MNIFRFVVIHLYVFILFPRHLINENTCFLMKHFIRESQVCDFPLAWLSIAVFLGDILSQPVFLAHCANEDGPPSPKTGHQTRPDPFFPWGFAWHVTLDLLDWSDQSDGVGHPKQLGEKGHFSALEVSHWSERPGECGVLSDFCLPRVNPCEFKIHQVFQSRGNRQCTGWGWKGESMKVGSW